MRRTFLSGTMIKSQHGDRVEILVFTSGPIPLGMIPEWPQESEPLVLDPAEDAEHPRHIVDLH